MADSFVLPDMSGSEDIAQVLACCPAEAMTRGMFLADIVDALRRNQLPLPARTYQTFGNYPQREFISVASDAAGHLFPRVSQREALRLLGQSAYPVFAQTLIGKVMFGVLGNDIGSIMRIAPRGYASILSHGHADLVESGPKFVRVKLVNVHTFLSSYQVGVFEGALLACEVKGTVKVRYDNPTNGEFLVEW
jgi:uncharacterized protein (TIGR02265 family)